MLLIEEDILGFDWGKGPKSYPEKHPVCHRFSTDTLTEQQEAASGQNRHLLDLTLITQYSNTATTELENKQITSDDKKVNELDTNNRFKNQIFREKCYK